MMNSGVRNSQYGRGKGSFRINEGDKGFTP